MRGEEGPVARHRSNGDKLDTVSNTEFLLSYAGQRVTNLNPAAFSF